MNWPVNGNNQPWGGLGKNVATAQTKTLIDDTPTSSTYWMSIGAFVATSTSGSGTNIIKRMFGPRGYQVTKVELYVRGKLKCDIV